MSDSLSPTDTRLLVSINDAAKQLGVSTLTIRRMLDRGDLNDHRIGRRRLITAESLTRLLTGGPR